MFEYTYGIYNFGQYPAEMKETWDKMVADGWQAHTAIPNYTEVYVFWQRELPKGEKSSGSKKADSESSGA